MRIYLDESKKINLGKKGQFIFGGLITTYKPSTIDKIYFEFLDTIGFKNKGKELKSTDRFYKDKVNYFYRFLEEKGYMENIEFYGIYIEEYKESGENYIEMLSILFEFIIDKNKFQDENMNKMQIIADNLKLNKNQKDIEKSLNNNLYHLLNYHNIQELGFKFFNSKKYGGLMFADFIAGILKKKYIDNKEELDYEFVEYLVNKEVKIIKILNK